MLAALPPSEPIPVYRGDARLGVQEHDLKNFRPWDMMLMGVERRVSAEDKEFCTGDIKCIASSAHDWFHF